jgi:hypothetical protein
MSRADWAVYDYVRAGIEAKSRIARVEEEREQLNLHARQMTYWLQRQTTALLQRDCSIPDRVWSAKLIHRSRIVRSLLDMKGGILCVADCISLSDLNDRIIEAIDPFNIGVTWPEQLAQAGLHRAEQGDAESEYSEHENQMDARDEEDGGIAEAMTRPEMQELAAAAVDAVLVQEDAHKDGDDEHAAFQVQDIDEMLID